MDINDAVSYIPHQVTATSGPIEECGDCDILVFSAAFAEFVSGSP